MGDLEEAHIPRGRGSTHFYGKIKAVLFRGSTHFYGEIKAVLFRGSTHSYRENKAVIFLNLFI